MCAVLHCSGRSCTNLRAREISVNKRLTFFFSRSHVKHPPYIHFLKNNLIVIIIRFALWQRNTVTNHKVFSCFAIFPYLAGGKAPFKKILEIIGRFFWIYIIYRKTSLSFVNSANDTEPSTLLLSNFLSKDLGLSHLGQRLQREGSGLCFTPTRIPFASLCTCPLVA